MFVFEIKILNYKAFKHKINLEHLSPGVNILTGSNGSGKTTFMEGVSLLFSKSVRNLKKKSEFFNNYNTGPLKKIFSLVQISIDNSDRTIPISNNIITIKRVFGQNFDKFLIFNKNFSPEQFLGFLDSIGLCYENLVLGIKQGGQTKIRDMTSSIRLKFLEKKMGFSLFSRFKKKIHSLLKIVNLYKKEITESVLALFINTRCIFTKKKVPGKKNFIEATFLIFEKICQMEFKSVCNKKLEKLKIKTYLENIMNSIIIGRKVMTGRQNEYVEIFFKSKYALEYNQNSKSHERLFCKGTDCLGVKKLETVNSLVKIQSTQNLWFFFPIGFFRGKIFEPLNFEKKKNLKVQNRNLTTYFSNSVKKKSISQKKKNCFEKQKLILNTISHFFSLTFQTISSQKFKIFEFRQKLAHFVYGLLNQKEKIEKFLENSEINLFRILGNKTVYGIKIILKLVKDSILFKSKVFGLFFDLLSVHRFFFKPIENILGRIISYIVVEDQETALSIIEKIKRSSSIKGAFVPLKLFKPEKKNKIEIQNFFPIIAALFFRKKFSNLFSYFFNHTFIPRNSFIFFKKFRNSNTQLVTLDGEIFLSNGIVSFRKGYEKSSIFEITSNLKKERILAEWLREIYQNVKSFEEIVEKNFKEAFLLEIFSNKINHFYFTKRGFIYFQQKDCSSKKNLVSLKILEKQKDLDKLLFPKRIKSSWFLIVERKNCFHFNQIQNQISHFFFLFLNQFFEFHTKLFNKFFYFINFRVFRKCKNWIFPDKKVFKNQFFKLKKFPDHILSFTLQTSFEMLQKSLFEFFFKKKSLEKFLYRWENFFKRIRHSNRQKYSSKIFSSFFSKKNHFEHLKIFQTLTNKWKKVNSMKENEKLSLKKKRLFELINYSKEIEMDLFIFNQTLEVLFKKRHGHLKNSFFKTSKNFTTIFEKILPDGKACLVLQKKKNFTESVKSKLPKKKKEWLNILAKFEKTGPFFFLEQMSDGQASLITIVLSLSIRNLNQFLIYLFDEIDANLDFKYCTLMSFLFKKFSSSGNQFIISTFRKETIQTGDRWFGIFISKNFTRIKGILKEDAFKLVNNKLCY